MSPGVYSQELDLSDIVPRVATAPAAIVGYSVKGDVNNIRLITSDQQFIEQYGEPDPSYLSQGSGGIIRKSRAHPRLYAEDAGDLPPPQSIGGQLRRGG